MNTLILALAMLVQSPVQAEECPAPRPSPLKSGEYVVVTFSNGKSEACGYRFEIDGANSVITFIQHPKARARCPYSDESVWANCEGATCKANYRGAEFEFRLTRSGNLYYRAGLIDLGGAASREKWMRLIKLKR